MQVYGNENEPPTEMRGWVILFLGLIAFAGGVVVIVALASLVSPYW